MIEMVCEKLGLDEKDLLIKNLEDKLNTQRKYYQNRLMKIQQENKQLKEENDKKLDRLINFEEKLLDYQGRLSLLKITIKNFLCTEEYINVDGKAIANNYEKLLQVIKGGNDE